MPLKAKKPDQIEKRLKLFLYGPRGVGKTIAALQFPNAYIIDLEKGTENYTKSITKSGSVVLQTSSPDEIENEIKFLLTEKHPYKTVIIDPITEFYSAVQEKWNRLFSKYAKNEKESEMQDFGPRYWGRVKAEHKGFLRMLKKLDMNIICTSHQKDLYGPGMTKIGVGPDSEKGDEYAFDLVFQLENPTGKMDGKRIGKTVKERSEIGEWKFPPEFEWSYDNFRKFYGAEILEKESTPISLATVEQIHKAKSLLEVVRIPDDEVAAWFTKAGIDSWEEFTSAQIEKVIDHLDKKLNLVMKKSA